jgi:hypothetical protein
MSLFQLDMVGKPSPWPALCCRHTLFCGETPGCAETHPDLNGLGYILQAVHQLSHDYPVLDARPKQRSKVVSRGEHRPRVRQARRPTTPLSLTDRPHRAQGSERNPARTVEIALMKSGEARRPENPDDPARRPDGRRTGASGSCQPGRRSAPICASFRRARRHQPAIWPIIGPSQAVRRRAHDRSAVTGPLRPDRLWP